MIRTTDFRPAAPGWRAVWLAVDPDDEDLYHVEPITGWLVQVNSITGKSRVVAGTLDPTTGQVEPVSPNSLLLFVLRPDQPNPSTTQVRRRVEEIEAERESKGLSSLASLRVRVTEALA